MPDLEQNFVPLEAHIKEHPVYFHRFRAVWTPTILVLDPNGEERSRIEGYLPRNEFRAQLEMGLARVSRMRKQFADAEQRYARIIEVHPQTKVIAEALYWRNVCRYNPSYDPSTLQSVGA